MRREIICCKSFKHLALICVGLRRKKPRLKLSAQSLNPQGLDLRQKKTKSLLKSLNPNGRPRRRKTRRGKTQQEPGRNTISNRTRPSSTLSLKSGFLLSTSSLRQRSIWGRLWLKQQSRWMPGTNPTALCVVFWEPHTVDELSET